MVSKIQEWLKGHLIQSECIAVVHFTEIICCNTEIKNVLIVFENRIVSSQPKAIAGCDTLLKRNIDTILLSSTQITFLISVFGEVYDRNANRLNAPL